MTPRLTVLRAALEQDAQACTQGWPRSGSSNADDPRFDPSHVLEHVRAINAWYATTNRSR